MKVFYCWHFEDEKGQKLYYFQGSDLWRAAGPGRFGPRREDRQAAGGGAVRLLEIQAGQARLSGL